jgi:hypothetical protein
MLARTGKKVASVSRHQSGAAPTAHAFEAVIESQAAALDRAAEVMKTAELSYTAEQADDVAPRDKRDALTTEAFGLMVRLRSAVEDALGAKGLSTYGLSGETPRMPRTLVVHMDNVLSLMSKQPASVTTALGGTFDTATLVTALSPKRAALEAVLKDLDREERELEGALVKRDKTVERWTEVYQGVATALSGLFRLAGRKDLAERVRPTSRRVSGEETGDEQGAGSGSGEPGAGATGDHQ